MSMKEYGIESCKGKDDLMTNKVMEMSILADKAS